jgi:hypothetical protein
MPARRGPQDQDDRAAPPPGQANTGEHTPPAGLPRLAPPPLTPDWATHPGHSVHAEGTDPAGMLEFDLEPEPDTPQPRSFVPPPFAPTAPAFAPPVPPFPPATSAWTAPVQAPAPVPPPAPPATPFAGSAGRYTFAGPIAAATSEWRPLAAPRLGLAVRLCATVALLTIVGTYVAAQVDFLRRHQPGIAPETYWIPQLLQIWAPGLAVGTLFAVSAVILHRWQQRAARRP